MMTRTSLQKNGNLIKVSTCLEANKVARIKLRVDVTGLGL